MEAEITTHVLEASDIARLRAILAVFAEAFEDRATYLGAPPADAYLEDLLASDSFVAIAAFADDAGGAAVGGITGYLLCKPEQQRSEFYIYDLAVAETHRRRGVASAMIERLKAWARDRGVYVIFVQADYGDDPAVALYTQLGTREDVMHFDILPAP